MSGHGGFIDRFDTVIWAVLLYWTVAFCVAHVIIMAVIALTCVVIVGIMLLVLAFAGSAADRNGW
jgi:CDP-diglyceride synthetase